MTIIVNGIYETHYHRILVVEADDRMVKCVMTPMYGVEPPRIALIPTGHVERHLSSGFWKYRSMKATEDAVGN